MLSLVAKVLKKLLQPEIVFPKNKKKNKKLSISFPLFFPKKSPKMEKITMF